MCDITHRLVLSKGCELGEQRNVGETKERGAKNTLQIDTVWRTHTHILTHFVTRIHAQKYRRMCQSPGRKHIDMHTHTRIHALLPSTDL